MAIRNPNENESIKEYDELQTDEINNNMTEIGTIKQSILTILSKLNLISDWVIESDSNANGTWEKWASGKLVQWGRVNAPVTSVNVGQQQNQTYPIPFVGAVPSLQLTSQVRFGQGECVVISETLSSFTTYALRKDATYSTRYSWQAIGRW